MGSPLLIGAQASVTAATSLVVNNDAGTTAGQKLVLVVAYGCVSTGSAQTPGAISGWSLAYGPTSAASAVGSISAGVAVYTKTAAGGSESATFNNPSGGSDLYAHGLIYTYAASDAATFDKSAAVTLHPDGSTTTGDAGPTTGTLAAANSSAFLIAVIGSGSGSAASNIQTTDVSWTVDITDNDTASTTGALFGHKSTAATTALGAPFTWASQDTYVYQLAIAVFSDGASGPTINTQPANQTCYVGQTATFTISATTSGGTLHYQWKDNGSNVGTDSNSYTTAAATLSNNGDQITCVVTDDNGNVTSAAATWTVLPAATTAWIKA